MEQQSTTPIDFYWRPGCPFCSHLKKGLELKGVKLNMINIWESAQAAEFVRSVANGNETVPTVTIGNQSLVNPSVRKVLKLLEN